MRAYAQAHAHTHTHSVRRRDHASGVGTQGLRVELRNGNDRDRIVERGFYATDVLERPREF